MFSEKFLMSDGFGGKLMLTKLLFVFSIFPLLLGRK